MKKFLFITMAVLMLIGFCCLIAFAEDAVFTSADLYVTIVDQNGELVLTQEKITVTDIDKDGVLTINDAMYTAHEAKYPGGAEAGYGSEFTSCGLSMTKLWGTENGSGYGYYVNNASAWSLEDAVKEGDYVNAFVYTDLTAWSDKYCFFNVNFVSKKEGETLILALSTYKWNHETYQNDVVPVEGAVITIDGVATEYKTGTDGTAAIALGEAGTVVISASSGTQTLVPPVCKVTVVEKETDATYDTNSDTPRDNQTPEEEYNYTVPTNFMIVALVVVSGVVVFVVKRKEN